jgi:predicted transcriptional regulator
MDVGTLCRELDLEVQAGRAHLGAEVTGGYASDLLSCVMARAQAGNVWVTLQAHPNIVAVASLLNLSGIIVTEGVDPESATLSKAEEQGIPILTTGLTTFTVVGKLVGMGISAAEPEGIG